MRYTQGLSEITLLTEDVQTITRFYRDVVKLEPEMQGDRYAWFWTGQPGQSTRLGILTGPLNFEEHSPNPEGRRWGRFHYAFHVNQSSLEAAVAHVRNCGVEVFGPETLNWMKAKAYYFYDPDGNFIEFWSPTES